MAFASPSERSCERWNRLALVPPLVGLGSLPPMYLPRVHSGEPKPPLVQRRQALALVPSSWFRTTSTSFSAQKLRVCCTPLPAKGSPRFVHAGRAIARRRSRCRGQSPQCVSHPSKSSPRQQPDTHHCGRCLPVVTVLPGGGSGRNRSSPTASPLMRGAYVRGQPAGPRVGSEEPGGHRVPRGGAAVPKSGGRPVSLGGGGFLPCRLGESPVPKSRGPEAGGKREGGAPKSSVAGSRGRSPGLRRASAALVVRGSEEPVATVSRRGGSDGPKTGGPPRWRGSAPSGRVVPAGPGQGVGAPKSLGGDARNNRGPSPKAGAGCEEEVPMR